MISTWDGSLRLFCGACFFFILVFKSWSISAHVPGQLRNSPAGFMVMYQLCTAISCYSSSSRLTLKITLQVGDDSCQNLMHNYVWGHRVTLNCSIRREEGKTVDGPQSGGCGESFMRVSKNKVHIQFSLCSGMLTERAAVTPYMAAGNKSKSMSCLCSLSLLL